jgi:tight adherence protein C
VEVGWSFDQAVAYINDHFRSPVTVLLRQTYAAIAAGQARHDALRALGEQCNIPALSALLNTILVTEQSGGSIGPMLRIQAEDLRMAQRQRIEQKIKKTPMKMTLVTTLFIFPSILCTLLAPAAVTVMQNLLHIG